MICGKNYGIHHLTHPCLFHTSTHLKYLLQVSVVGGKAVVWGRRSAEQKAHGVALIAECRLHADEHIAKLLPIDEQILAVRVEVACSTYGVTVDGIWLSSIPSCVVNVANNDNFTNHKKMVAAHRVQFVPVPSKYWRTFSMYAAPPTPLTPLVTPAITLQHPAWQLAP